MINTRDALHPQSGRADKARATALKAEQVLADCMAKQGFKYTPWTSPNSAFAATGSAPGTLAYVQRYGFEIVDSPLFDDAKNGPINPNLVYRDSLAVSEKYSYNVAYEGKVTADIEAGRSDGTDAAANSSDTGGCQGLSQRTVYPTQQPVDLQEAKLFDDAKRADATVDQDTRMMSIEHKWSECMIAAGYSSYASRAAMVSQYRADYTAINQADKNAVSEFHAKEIQAAVVDFTCAEKVGYAPIHRQVTQEIENKFIADHRVELDALIARNGGK